MQIPPNSSTQNPGNLRSEIRALQSRLIEWRRHIHQEPELGFKERLTAEYVAELLQGWGIEHQTGIAETGIVAMIKGEKPGDDKVLGIRADMDALPIQEENQVSYRSRHKGVMHACGHDGHTAIALGTAYYLNQHRQDFSGGVKIIFQPAEEGPGGAKPMIEAGVLENPAVDAIIGLHLWNDLPIGSAAIKPGAFMAAISVFNCTILGQGGHAALPHQTIDSVVISAQVVNALQTIVSRNINPLDSAVISIGELHAGTKMNVIADTARIAGSIRYFNDDVIKLIEQRIEQVIDGICRAHGAKYTFECSKIYPPLVNDPEITALVTSKASQLIENPESILSEYQTLGSEDMSF